MVNPVQLGGFLRALHAYRGAGIVSTALKLAPMLFARPGELRQAEWAEMDLDAGLWSIPAARMKMRQPHIAPLACQAVEILRELKPYTESGKYVPRKGQEGSPDV